jgi:hypothetical protein
MAAPTLEVVEGGTTVGRRFPAWEFPASARKAARASKWMMEVVNLFFILRQGNFFLESVNIFYEPNLSFFKHRLINIFHAFWIFP